MPSPLRLALVSLGLAAVTYATASLTACATPCCPPPCDGPVSVARVASMKVPETSKPIQTEVHAIAPDPLVGIWQYHFFGSLPTDEEIDLGGDGRFVWKGSNRVDQDDRFSWNRSGRWNRDGETVVLRDGTDGGVELRLRAVSGFLEKVDPEDSRVSGRFLLKGRDFPEAPIVGERRTEQELIGKYEFYSPLSPNGPRDPERTLTLDPHARFQAVTKWSDGKGFYGKVTYEGTWTIEGDRIVLDATVWPQERHDPWPKHETYVTMRDGVLLYGKFHGLRGGAPYYKKVN